MSPAPSLMAPPIITTFNRKVPGPFVRARVGDTIKVSLHNLDDSAEPHNVDFHAATGPGGGGRRNPCRAW